MGALIKNGQKFLLKNIFLQIKMVKFFYKNGQIFL